MNAEIIAFRIAFIDIPAMFWQRYPIEVYSEPVQPLAEIFSLQTGTMACDGHFRLKAVQQAYRLYCIRPVGC